MNIWKHLLGRNFFHQYTGISASSGPTLTEVLDLDLDADFSNDTIFSVCGLKTLGEENRDLWFWILLSMFGVLERNRVTLNTKLLMQVHHSARSSCEDFIRRNCIFPRTLVWGEKITKPSSYLWACCTFSEAPLLICFNCFLFALLVREGFPS